MIEHYVIAKSEAPRALAYCKSIRNSAKKAYAYDYLAWKLGKASEPSSADYACSFMACQAVRLSMRELLP